MHAYACFFNIVQFYSKIIYFITDLDNIINAFSKKSFTGHYIKAEKVPACTSVIIKHIPPEKCDKDSLDLYFSNKKKSGVDQYKTIEILANDVAVVDFGDEQSKQHTQFTIMYHVYNALWIFIVHTSVMKLIFSQSKVCTAIN